MMTNSGVRKMFRPDLENPTLEDALDSYGTIHLLDTPWVEPEDVSAAILYLVSDDGRFVTGTQFAVDAGMLAGHRGHRLSAEDKLRARAIEMLMCDFRIDVAALHDAFGAAAGALAPIHAAASRRFAGLVRTTSDAVEILPQGRPLARMIATQYDGYAAVEATFSKAS